MAIVPMTNGIDVRATLVDTSGSPVSVGGGTQYVDGTAQNPATGTAIEWNDSGTLRVVSAAKPLPVSVTGGGSATSATDAAAWTAGASLFNPQGGVFNDTATALTTGQQGTQRLTPNRAAHANLRSQNGTEILPVPAALADGTANPTLTQIQTFPVVYNGTTWDRWKDMAAAQAQTTFTGIPAVAPFYLDTTGTPSVRRAVTAASTTGGVSGTQVPSGSMTVYDGTNFQAWRQVTSATGTTGAGIAGSGPLLWDLVGTTNFVKQAGDGSGRAMVVGAAAAGSAIAGNPVLSGGSDGTNARAFSTDTSGRMQIASINGALPAGSATIGAVNQGTQNGGGTASWNVQGAGAAGSAVGNPVVAGVTDGANAQYLRQPTASGVAVAGTGLVAMVPHFWQSSNNFAPLQSAGAGNSDGVSGTSIIGVAGWISNGTSFDRIRNNVDVTLLSSAARTTTQTSSDVITYNCIGIMLTLDVTAVTSTVSLTLSVNYKDPASGKYIPLTSFAAVTGISTNMYIIDPRIVAGTNIVQKTIGRTIQVVVTAGNANSQTYSVGYTLIPA